nr:IclR family transcriptional regulator [Deinococcus geothermalis]
MRQAARRTEMLGTFEKARAILDLYTTERSEWGVSEVARQLGMPTSSAHVLLASLAELGVLHRTVAGRYRLGFKLLALSQVLLANTPWREVAQEEMNRLGRALGETLHLAALDGNQVVLVAGVPGHLPGSVRLPRVGTVLSALTSASGQVLLAHRPREVVEAVLAATEDPLTWDILVELLEQVRTDGCAREIGKPALGHSSLAAPVRNHNGEVIAALACSVPSDRFRDREGHLRAALVQACTQISLRIGYHPELSGKGLLVWSSVEGRDKLYPAARRSGARRRPKSQTP